MNHAHVTSESLDTLSGVLRAQWDNYRERCRSWYLSNEYASLQHEVQSFDMALYVVLNRAGMRDRDLAREADLYRWEMIKGAPPDPTRTVKFRRYGQPTVPI